MNCFTSSRTTYDLGSQEIRKFLKSFETSQYDSLVPSLTAKMKILIMLANYFQKQQLNFTCGTLFHMKTSVSLSYFMTGCFYKPFFDSIFPQTFSKLISFTIFLTLSPLTLFLFKVGAIKLQKAARSVSADNCFFHLFKGGAIKLQKAARSVSADNCFSQYFH